MTATFVTVAQLRTALGIGSLYSNDDLESVCQTSQDLIDKMLWHNFVPVVAASIQNNIATIAIASNPAFNIGQTITLSNCGIYDGARVITGVVPYATGFPVTWYPYNLGLMYTGWGNNNPGISYLQFAYTHADDVFHLIRPYGKGLGAEYNTAYASTPAINNAALMLAVDIWQARTVAGGNGASSVDFGTPTPYKMGRSLMSRISGLLAPYMSPASMVG